MTSPPNRGQTPSETRQGTTIPIPKPPNDNAPTARPPTLTGAIAQEPKCKQPAYGAIAKRNPRFHRFFQKVKSVRRYECERAAVRAILFRCKIPKPVSEERPRMLLKSSRQIIPVPSRSGESKNPDCRHENHHQAGTKQARQIRTIRLILGPPQNHRCKRNEQSQRDDGKLSEQRFDLAAFLIRLGSGQT